MALISGQQLHDYPDSFVWNLDAEGVFSVDTTRKFIDDNNMIHALTGTRWLANQVWRKISRWCGVTISVGDSIQEWYDGVVDSSRSSESKIKFEVIVIASIWILWRFWNSVVFNNNPIRRSNIFDLIVLTSFNWLKVRASKMHMSWNDWVSNPL
ncbi:RNA-directed DNA polymerase, eukaryota [Artemisia annua]|uniref:RNA-directed DNA polymerase, eukaryota n=1 Tax=Artemisia annua TaxID=35608 RepID=A0A2U1Q1H5_ARTAN|nr:RNA-directed DNA polymerase, eukaryota [Artemisia annua]